MKGERVGKLLRLLRGVWKEIGVGRMLGIGHGGKGGGRRGEGLKGGKGGRWVGNDGSLHGW